MIVHVPMAVHKEAKDIRVSSRTTPPSPAPMTPNGAPSTSCLLYTSRCV